MDGGDIEGENVVKVDQGPGPGVGIGTNIGMDISAGIGMDIGVDMGVGIGTDIGADMGVGIGAGIGADIGAGIGAGIGPAGMGMEVSWSALITFWEYLSNNDSIKVSFFRLLFDSEDEGEMPLLSLSNRTDLRLPKLIDETEETPEIDAGKEVSRS